MGYGVHLIDPKYSRYALSFCIGMVFNEKTELFPYEPVLCKLGSSLQQMEIENELIFLEKNKILMKSYLKIAFNGLNTNGMCSIYHGKLNF